MRLPLPRVHWAARPPVRGRKSQLWVGRAAALTLAGALLAGCTASGSAAKDGGSLNPGTTVFEGGTGPRAPAITGTLVDGKKFTLTSDRGHVVVLNFWGSWCSVCHAEAPALAAVARQSTASGLRFLGVDVNDNTASAMAYMSDYRISYPSLNDPGDSIALDFRGTIPIAAFPSTLVIARSGRLAGRIIGAVTCQGLTTMIKEAEKDPG